MHTIIASECTGCELCLPPCPVDCIALVPTAEHPLSRALVMRQAGEARARFEAREARLARERRNRDARRAPSNTDVTRRAPITRSAVLEAIARGKARRAAGAKGPR